MKSGTVDLQDSGEKVRWLLALAQRVADQADIDLLPEDFPRFERQEQLAHALEATASEFSNWFPKPNKTAVSKPRVEAIRKIAKIFGFAPPTNEANVWREWWTTHWPSFLPSEEAKSNKGKSASVAEFKEVYRAALRGGRLTFPEFAGTATGGVLHSDDMSASPTAPAASTGFKTTLRKPALWSGVGIAIFAFVVVGLILRPWHPTVDLTRTIDFSKLSCDAEGNKYDSVVLVDDFTVVSFFSFARTLVRVADLRRRKDAVEAYDLNVDSKNKVLAIQDDTNEEHRLQSYAFAIKGSHASIEWVWTNAHSSPQEGTGITGGDWTLRNLTVNYTMPHDRAVTKITKLPSKTCVAGRGSLYCPDLNTSNAVEIWWDWDVWDSCKK